MKLFKSVNLFFDSNEEMTLEGFVRDKFDCQQDVEDLRTICENILSAIRNDSKSVISDIKPKIIKQVGKND